MQHYTVEYVLIGSVEVVAGDEWDAMKIIESIEDSRALVNKSWLVILPPKPFSACPTAIWGKAVNE